MKKIFGVFKINNQGLLELQSEHSTLAEAESYAKTGSRMVVLPIYL